MWFPITLILLVINLSLLVGMSHWEKPKFPLSAVPPDENSFAASSDTPTVLSAAVIAGDARTLLLDNFLKSNDSPMEPYANLIVAEADQHGLPFQLIPAIAMCESNLGKHVPLKSGFNPFGIAVYTGTQQGKNFTSWEDAITWVSQYIHDTYYAHNITKLTDIEKSWAPPAVTNGDSWANCVQYFESSIQ